MEASATATIDPAERIRAGGRPGRRAGPRHRAPSPERSDGVWADLLAPDSPFRRSSGRGLFGGLAKRAARLLRPAERNFLVDASMLGLAVLAAVITAPDAGIPVEATGWLLAFPLLTLGLLATRGMYRRVSGLRFLKDVRTIVCMAAVAAMAVTFVRVLSGDEPYAASQALREFLFAAVVPGRGPVCGSDRRAQASIPRRRRRPDADRRRGAGRPPARHPTTGQARDRAPPGGLRGRRAPGG